MVIGPSHVNYTRLNHFPTLRVPNFQNQHRGEQLRQQARRVRWHVHHHEDGGRKIGRQRFYQFYQGYHPAGGSAK